jgi:hypothetical protein
MQQATVNLRFVTLGAFITVNGALLSGAAYLLVHDCEEGCLWLLIAVALLLGLANEGLLLLERRTALGHTALINRGQRIQECLGLYDGAFASANQTRRPWSHARTLTTAYRWATGLFPFGIFSLLLLQKGVIWPSSLLQWIQAAAAAAIVLISVAFAFCTEPNLEKGGSSMTKSTWARVILSGLSLVVSAVLLIRWHKEIAGFDPICRWAIGLAFSLVIGAFTTWAFLTWLRWHLRLGDNPLGREGHGSRPVPPWLTGGMERLFFTTLLGLDISGVPIAMIAWITVKMVSNWNRAVMPGSVIDPMDARPVRGAFSALLAGLVSMLFAGTGGVICKG